MEILPFNGKHTPLMTRGSFTCDPSKGLMGYFIDRNGNDTLIPETDPLDSTRKTNNVPGHC